MPQVNKELRNRARRRGPNEEEFLKLANSVEEFASSLLDPLRTDKYAKHDFQASADFLVEESTKSKMKKVRVTHRDIVLMWLVARHFALIFPV